MVAKVPFAIREEFQRLANLHDPGSRKTLVRGAFASLGLDLEPLVTASRVPEVNH